MKFFSEENKAHVYLETESKVYDIIEEIEYNSIRIILYKKKSLKVHEIFLKEKLNHALKETNDAKLDQKYEKDQVINFQEQMGKKSQN